MQPIIENQETKTTYASARCTPKEKAELKLQAEKSNMTLSDFILAKCLHNSEPLCNIAMLPEIFALINKYQRGHISEKEFAEQIIRKVEKLCQQ